MFDKTQLKPIGQERASELFEMLRQGQQDESKAIALDDKGFVTGVVDVEKSNEQHLLGDLDVHA